MICQDIRMLFCCSIVTPLFFPIEDQLKQIKLIKMTLMKVLMFFFFFFQNCVKLGFLFLCLLSPNATQSLNQLKSSSHILCCLLQCLLCPPYIIQLSLILFSMCFKTHVLNSWPVGRSRPGI